MSILVYRDGVLAADSGTWQDHYCVATNSVKVVSGPYGLAGWVGGNSWRKAAEEFVQFGQEPQKPFPADDVALLVDQLGTCQHWNSDGRDPLEAPFFVAGSAMASALGALLAGATAEQAAEIAIRVGPWAAGPVQSVRLPLPAIKSIVSDGMRWESYTDSFPLQPDAKSKETVEERIAREGSEPVPGYAGQAAARTEPDPELAVDLRAAESAMGSLPPNERPERTPPQDWRHKMGLA